MENEAAQRAKRQRIRKDERKRTARACDECRRLKEKCEGGVPCRKCARFGRPCEFKDAAFQNGVSRPHIRMSSYPIPEADVSELQERLACMERILKHNHNDIPLDTSSLRRIADNIAEGGAGNNGPSDSSPPEESGLAMDEEVCTIDPVEDTVTHYSGEFSYWNFSMRIKRQIEERMSGLTAQQTQDSSHIPNYWRAKQLRPSFNSLASAISCVPPRHIADFLVNIFFKYAEAHYFYVDKTWLLERLNGLYTDPGKFNSKDAAVISIILTIFAIGTQYAYLDSTAHKAADRSDPGYSEDELGTMFYQEAIRLLPEIIESSSLESVQACLLFAAYSLPIDASGLGYIYLSLTIRLAMQNGMHRKYIGNAFHPSMIEVRNRVWWTAYTMERKISIFHGRPLAMVRSDIDSDLPCTRENTSLGSPSSTVQHLVASIVLSQHLEDFFDHLSNLRACQKQEVPNVLSRLIGKKETLETWWKSLPYVGRTDRPENQAQSRSTMHLRLEYCLIRMFVGRPFLLSRVSSHSDPNTPAGSEGKTPSDAPNTGSQRAVSHRQDLVLWCIQAATEALQICSALRDSGPGLARASYIEYSSCRASLLVLIAHSIQGQSDQFRKYLRQGLNMIREMAASGDSARSEVLLIEALEQALAHLHIVWVSRQHGHDDVLSVDPSAASNYESFKHWESLWKTSTAVDTSPLEFTQTSTTAQPRMDDRHANSWPMGASSREDDSSFTISGNGISLSPFWPFYSPAELALFSNGTTMPLSSNSLIHPESQATAEFL